MAKEPVPGIPGYEADQIMRAVSYDSVLVQQGVTEYKLLESRYNSKSEVHFHVN